VGARRTPAAGETFKELHMDAAAITQNTRGSGEEVCGLRTQIANALALASSAAMVDPRARKTKVRNFQTP